MKRLTFILIGCAIQCLGIYYMFNPPQNDHYAADPITIGLIIAGGVITAKGQADAGKAQNTQAKNEARIAEFNAGVARRQGDAEQAARVEAAKKQEREGKALKGRQIATIGKSGVDFSGSTLSVLVDTASELERDRLTILREGKLAKQRGESRSAGLVLEADAARIRGKALQKAGKTKAIGTLLSTAGAASGAANSGKSPDQILAAKHGIL